MIRRSLEATPEFLARIHQPRAVKEIFDSMIANWKVIILGMLMVIITTVSFYLITAYTPTFGRVVLKLSEADALTVTICVGLSNFVWLPILGAISDRIGRGPVFIGFTILAILTVYPAMTWLVVGPTFGRMLIVELWLSFLYGSYNGAMVVALAETVPAKVRTAGFSLAYRLATALGGFSLAISTWLIEMTGNKAAPGLWMTFAAVCGLVAAVVVYFRRGQKTESVEAVAVS